MARGLKANLWAGCVSALINGKGGGKDTSAQASGSPNGVSVVQVVSAAKDFVKANLK